MDEVEGALADYVDAWNGADAAGAMAALAEAVADDVRFTDDAQDMSGSDALAEHIGALQAASAFSVTVSGAQTYGTHARIVLQLEDDAGVTEYRDYLLLNDEGLITRVGRFEGSITPL
jgi:hypothetical protein